VRRTGYDYVRIVGPDGFEFSCKVLKRDKGNKSWTELGKDWNLFTLLNKFKEGDVLKFRFVHHIISNLIMVAKM
jgi:hypothetical protein